MLAGAKAQIRTPGIRGVADKDVLTRVRQGARGGGGKGANKMLERKWERVEVVSTGPGILGAHASLLEGHRRTFSG